LRRDVEEVLVQAITTISDAMTEAATGDDPRVLQASAVDITFATTRPDRCRLASKGNWATS
jgi:hypothetical protein